MSKETTELLNKKNFFIENQEKRKSENRKTKENKIKKKKSKIKIWIVSDPLINYICYN